MQLIEDDAEVNPTIPPLQLNYIQCLADKHKQYTRFFDALLVPRPSHPAFLRDLKGFRALPTTVKIFTACDPDDTTVSKEQRREHYRNITRAYLGSRFAHPWCRKAMAGMGNTKAGGWWGAEWAATGRKMSRDQQEQEDKLHKLLIPIWVTFRSRMFPGDGVVQEWWEQRQVELQTKSMSGLTSSSTDTGSGKPEADSTTSSKQPGPRSAQNPNTNTSSDEDDGDGSRDEDEEEQEMLRQANTVGTGILRLAAASMIISSMPKMQQWKLKRELKKQQRR